MKINRYRGIGLSFRKTSRQGGFTLIELIVTMAIGAVVAATLNSTKVIETAENAIAEGTGEYLMVLREALSQYQLINYAALEANDPIPGFVDPLNPLPAELKTANLLNVGTPLVGPMGFTPVLQITRTNCPGAACQIVAMARTPGAFLVPRTGNQPRYDLAIVASNVMRGTYGISYPGDEANLRGATFNVPNPAIGQPGAVLATVAFLNASFFNQFLRVQDSRDPDFQGNLSAVGNLSIVGTSNLQGNTTVGGTLTVTGATTFNNNVTGTGTIGTGPGGGCNLAEMQANGNIISQNDCAGTIRATTSPSGFGVARNGVSRISINALPAVSGVTLRDPAGTTRSMTTSAGMSSSYDAAGVEATRIDATTRRLSALNSGGVETAYFEGGAGRGTMNVARLTRTESANSACVDDGDIVRDASAGGTILMCVGGVWRPPGLMAATAGAACAQQGAIGQDANGVAFICRGTPLAWNNVNDRVTRQVLIARFGVTDGSDIPKPACPVGATQAVVLTPAETGSDYASSPPRNRFTASVIDTGTQWIAFIRLADGTGVAYATSFAGSAYAFQAIASTYCDFPSGS